MQRKPGFPVANCSIKMPDNLGSVVSELGVYEEDSEQQQRRLQLINFGHSQWGFNNWSWAVTKQELDFIELTNGKYCAGVVAFVSITVKSFDIHRENIGYATSNANNKGFAIYKSRKCAVTNALRETLLSFGGTVATELLELLETNKSDLTTSAPPPAPAPALAPAPAPEPTQENNQNIANKQAEPKNSVNNLAAAKNVKEGTPAHNQRPHAVPKNSHAGSAPRSPPPVGRAHPMSGPRSPPPVGRAHPMSGPRSPPPVGRAHPMSGPRSPPPVGRAHPMSGPRGPVGAGPPPRAGAPRAPSNDGKLDGMTEEEARAERKRRQRQAQEEFRLKQLMKNGNDDQQELSKNSSSLDRLLLDIPTQDIVIQETGDSVQARADFKRKSPSPDGNSAKKRACEQAEYRTN